MDAKIYCINVYDHGRGPSCSATFKVEGLGEVKIDQFRFSTELLTMMEKEARVVLDKKLGRST